MMPGIAQLVDVTFDFRSDTPAGGDPDALSPTLRRYHQGLWGRALSSGDEFTLDPARPGHYLYRQSSLGEFTLSSDSIIPTFMRWVRMQPIVTQIPEEENEAFRAIGFLQDLMTADHSEVVFFMPFDAFRLPAVPQDVGTYLEYRRRSIDFIAARSSRIDEAVNLRTGEADAR